MKNNYTKNFSKLFLWLFNSLMSMTTAKAQIIVDSTWSNQQLAQLLADQV